MEIQIIKSEWSSWSCAVSRVEVCLELRAVHEGLLEISLHEWLLCNDFLLHAGAELSEATGVGVVGNVVVNASHGEVGEGGAGGSGKEWFAVHLEAVLEEVAHLLPGLHPLGILLCVLVWVEGIASNSIELLLGEVKDRVDGVHSLWVGRVVSVVDGDGSRGSLGLVDFDAVHLDLWHASEGESAAGLDSWPICLVDLFVSVCDILRLKHGTEKLGSSIEAEVSNSNC